MRMETPTTMGVGKRMMSGSEAHSLSNDVRRRKECKPDSTSLISMRLFAAQILSLPRLGINETLPLTYFDAGTAGGYIAGVLINFIK